MEMQRIRKFILMKTIQARNNFWIWLSLGGATCTGLLIARRYFADEIKKLREQGLLHRATAPAWSADNEFITGGFRPELATIRKCLLSVTTYHNETFNIYSHGLASAFAMVIIARRVIRYYRTGEGMGLGPQDQSLYLLLPLMSDAFVFGISTIAHTFTPFSKQVCDILFSLDKAAICVAIGTHVLALGMMGFHRNDQRASRILFQALTILATLSTASAVALDLPKSTTISCMGSIVFLSIFPVMAAMKAAMRTGNMKLVRKLIIGLVLGFGPLLIGGLMYTAQWPEKWLHKHKAAQPFVDVMIHGHALMHIWTVMAVWTGYLALKYWNRNLPSLIETKSKLDLNRLPQGLRELATLHSAAVIKSKELQAQFNQFKI